MLALVAAVLFGIALILDLADSGTEWIQILLLAGLVCVALHLGGIGAARNYASFRGRRRR